MQHLLDQCMTESEHDPNSPDYHVRITSAINEKVGFIYKVHIDMLTPVEYCSYMLNSMQPTMCGKLRYTAKLQSSVDERNPPISVTQRAL